MSRIQQVTNIHMFYAAKRFGGKFNLGIRLLEPVESTVGALILP